MSHSSQAASGNRRSTRHPSASRPSRRRVFREQEAVTHPWCGPLKRSGEIPEFSCAGFIGGREHEFEIGVLVGQMRERVSDESPVKLGVVDGCEKSGAARGRASSVPLMSNQVQLVDEPDVGN